MFPELFHLEILEELIDTLLLYKNNKLWIILSLSMDYTSYVDVSWEESSRWILTNRSWITIKRPTNFDKFIVTLRYKKLINCILDVTSLTYILHPWNLLKNKSYTRKILQIVSAAHFHPNITYSINRTYVWYVWLMTINNLRIRVQLFCF